MFGLPGGIAYLVLGLAAAPIMNLTPGLRRMAWFLGSLTHELGHSLAAWFCGSPAFPAIRLDGHAAAVQQPQNLFLALAVTAAIAYCAWVFRSRKALLVSFAVLVPIQALIAFTELKEIFFLLCGHVGELAFGFIFLWRAMVGGIWRIGIERFFYGMLCWFLVGRNILLFGGLVWSTETKIWYHHSGSFGLKNDYLRLAEDILDWPLERVAGFSLVPAILIVPVCIFLWLRSRR